MTIHQDCERSVARRCSSQPLPSKHVLKELDGRACDSCGARHYYLVLRVNARGDSPTLSARCSRCHEGSRFLSEARLAIDIEQALWKPTCRNVGQQTR